MFRVSRFTFQHGADVVAAITELATLVMAVGNAVRDNAAIVGWIPSVAVIIGTVRTPDGNLGVANLMVRVAWFIRPLGQGCQDAA